MVSIPTSELSTFVNNLSSLFEDLVHSRNLFLAIPIKYVVIVPSNGFLFRPIKIPSLTHILPDSICSHNLI